MGIYTVPRPEQNENVIETLPGVKVPRTLSLLNPIFLHPVSPSSPLRHSTDMTSVTVLWDWLVTVILGLSHPLVLSCRQDRLRIANWTH